MKQSFIKENTYLFLSKYTYKSILNLPKILYLNFNIILHYKQKNKYFLFINILLLIFFWTPKMKTRFFFKSSSINILQINLRNQTTILNFLYKFIFLYFPLIDSFSTELKIIQKKNIIKCCFLKFPLLFELNTLFLTLEYLYVFLNNYKFQLEFHFKKKNNNLINYNLLQYLKLPISLPILK